jgi:hypothetical protein
VVLDNAERIVEHLGQSRNDDKFQLEGRNPHSFPVSLACGFPKRFGITVSDPGQPSRDFPIHAAGLANP